MTSKERKRVTVSSSILTTKEWDTSSLKQRIKLLKDCYERYSCEGIDSFDVERLEEEMDQEIVLLISRVVASLEITLQRHSSDPSTSVYYHICVLCALISTKDGQIFIESSPNVISVLMQCLQLDLKSKENDLLISMIMIRRSCVFYEKLRIQIVHLRGMEIIGMILQQNEKSIQIQDAACALLLDLSSLNQNTHLVLSSILRTLINTPYLLAKHSAVKILSSILITASPVVINFAEWEHEFIAQMTRMLICAPLLYQYDVGELISMLFESENETVRNEVMSVISALLCVRYTLGGNSIVDPPDHWEYLFATPSEQSSIVHEVPEILVSIIIMTSLSSLDDVDLTRCSPMVTQLKVKFDILTTHMRTAKLHRSLLSHILWYVREKTVLHKVLSIWVDRTELNLQSSDNESHHRTTFRKVAKVARQWIQRKSSINSSTTNIRCGTPPELRRASVLLKASTDVNPSINDTEATSQDLACINSIRVLQKWLELDQMAHEDIISDLTQLGYEKQIAYITLKSGAEVIDFLPTLSNIVRIIKFHGSENQQVGKNSFLSNYLSQLMTPGELVKSLKVNLSNSLQFDRGCVYPLLASSSSSSLSTDNTRRMKTQELVDVVPYMPPPLQSLNTESVSQISSVQRPESELLPSPPQNSSHRGNRPSVREKRPSLYTKQYSDTMDADSSPKLDQSSPHYILRDGTPAKSSNGEKVSIVTPQDRLTLSTHKPTMKLADLKPSPPKVTPSEGIYSPPSPQDDFTPTKGRFVRQSLLRQRSPSSEEGQNNTSTNLDEDSAVKIPPRHSIIGGIQHGGYSQPSPPTKNLNFHARPHSRGRAIGGDHGNCKETKFLDVAAELDELMENEENRSAVAISISQQEEIEEQRIHHLGNVVNQLLDDEENLLLELESHNEALRTTRPPKLFPLTDPLVPNSSPRIKGSQAPTIFPDPVPKVKTSYPATLAQRKEKDTIILQSLASPDSNFAEITPNGNGKSVGARPLRDSNEENRTYFPEIFG